LCSKIEKNMATQETTKLYDLAKEHGYKTNHYLKMRDLKSGVILSGKFTKYRLTNGSTCVRLKGEGFEVEVITNFQPNFEVLYSYNFLGEIEPEEDKRIPGVGC